MMPRLSGDNNNSKISNDLQFLAVMGSSGLKHNKLSFGSSFDDTVEKCFSPYTPDPYQLEAARNLHSKVSTMVTAPTGTGKTLIAEYIIRRNMAEGKRTFYTTPLKALTNDKYREFCERFGPKNVGIMTGDIKHNVGAPIVIMTTEIYRNTLLGNKDMNLIKSLEM